MKFNEKKAITVFFGLVRVIERVDVTEREVEA